MPGALNHSGETRYAVGLQACRPWMKQRFDYPRLLSPELVATFSDRVKRFLGLNAQIPVNEDEFYVSQERRLYKANLDQPNYSDPSLFAGST
jgi:ectoine hydroxylase-related dioxygenase (phytanoyl-CoA dioxygenase family)